MPIHFLVASEGILSAFQGLIGVVTRPVSGVVDFASSTMHSVRRVAGAAEAGALRPPRVMRPDHIVRPYSYYEAIGFKIFNVGGEVEIL